MGTFTQLPTDTVCYHSVFSNPGDTGAAVTKSHLFSWVLRCTCPCVCVCLCAFCQVWICIIAILMLVKANSLIYLKECAGLPKPVLFFSE